MRLLDILGHRRAIDMLVQAHASGRIHHAYLFAGPEGIGKRRVAYAFMARVSCLALADDGDACGHCRNCRRIFAHAAWYDEHGPWKPPPTEPDVPLTPLLPDVATLVPYGSGIRIEQVREVRRIAQFAPVELPFRFILIDPADAMNEAAANALLKTLEEPPAKTRFILLSPSPTSLLVTIRSRCQRVDFHRLADAELDQILATRLPESDEEQRRRAARVAHGSAALAIELVDDPALAAWMPLARGLARVDSGRPGAILALAAEFEDLKIGPRTFELIVRFLRDALLIRVGSDEPVFHAEILDDVTAFAGARSIDGLMHRIRIAEDTRLACQTFHTPLLLGLERLLLEVIGPDGTEVARPIVDLRDVL